MTRELESRKDLVDEKVTRHDGSQEKAPSPRRIDLRAGEGWGEGSPNNGKYEPRPCGCSTRELVHNHFPARKGWGLRDGCPLLVERVRERVCYDDECYYAKPNVESGLPPHFTHLKKAAFTLAEILVTLGVIGIVAAMTIPNLVQSYQEKVTVTRLKKAYSIMNNAYQLAKIDNGEFGTWFSKKSGSGGTDENGNPAFSEDTKQVSDIIWDKFEPYLKVVSRCKATDETCQKYDAIYALDGTKRPEGYTKSTAILNLADGTSLAQGVINYLGNDCTDKVNCGEFIIDTNGYKTGPNTFGKDMFHFWFTKNSIVPNRTLSINVNIKDTCNPSVTGIRSGMACAAWVIQFENMDYLKCPDELSWNGKHKCSD